MIHSNTLNYLLTTISFVKKTGPLIFDFDSGVAYPCNGERTFLGHDRHELMLRNSFSKNNVGTALVIEHVNRSGFAHSRRK